MKLGVLAKSVFNAGRLGAQGIPEAVKAVQFGQEGQKFTLLNNSAALALAKTDL